MTATTTTTVSNWKINHNALNDKVSFFFDLEEQSEGFCLVLEAYHMAYDPYLDLYVDNHDSTFITSPEEFFMYTFDSMKEQLEEANISIDSDSLEDIVAEYTNICGMGA